MPAVSEALTPGTRLGAYEVVSLLGEGGMGQVYRADTKLNRDVALKILPEAFALDGDRIARFRREAQVLAVLKHPNIAAIYGFEDFGNTHALVLELVEGPTLADRIAKARCRSTRRCPLRSRSPRRSKAIRGTYTQLRPWWPAATACKRSSATRLPR
jgi:serine/threonine protein kinase